jgi:hypothetical protein
MNNIVLNFAVGETEKIYKVDTESDALVRLLVKGNVLSNTSLTFCSKSNSPHIFGDNWYPYKNPRTNTIISMPLVPNAWISFNPYVDLLGVVGDVKFILSQPQLEEINIELGFFINFLKR